LTKERARDFNVPRDQSHLAIDFCRLEADIKFYLTDLNNEQDLKQAWLLECLLLKYGLEEELPNWEDILPNTFEEILEERGLSNEPKWEELANLSYWQGDSARKFVLAWQSVKAIRDSFRDILRGELELNSAYYLALLQASLSMIYYQDERFHNANLQKLYIVMASALLCQKLL
jgi:hypothetical protein